MGERERGSRRIRVAARRGDDDSGATLLDAGRETLAGQGSLHHQPVQVGVAERPGAVRVRDRRERVVRAVGGRLEQIGDLAEPTPLALSRAPSGTARFG